MRVYGQKRRSLRRVTALLLSLCLLCGCALGQSFSVLALGGLDENETPILWEEEDIVDLREELANLIEMYSDLSEGAVESAIEEFGEDAVADYAAAWATLDALLEAAKPMLTDNSYSPDQLQDQITAIDEAAAAMNDEAEKMIVAAMTPRERVESFVTYYSDFTREDALDGLSDSLTEEQMAPYVAAVDALIAEWNAASALVADDATTDEQFIAEMDRLLAAEEDFLEQQRAVFELLFSPRVLLQAIVKSLQETEINFRENVESDELTEEDYAGLDAAVEKLMGIVADAKELLADTEATEEALGTKFLEIMFAAQDIETERDALLKRLYGDDWWRFKTAKPGDVDGDGEVTTTDARVMLQFCAGKLDDSMIIAYDLMIEEGELHVADVDGDSAFTTTDARLILQKCAGKIEHFPMEEDWDAYWSNYYNNEITIY